MRFESEIDTERVANRHISDKTKLRENETFWEIFHPGNVHTLQNPKNGHQKEICLRFHAVGFCFANCRFSHEALTDARELQICTFIVSVRHNRALYEQKRQAGKGKQWQQTMDLTTAKVKGEKT